MGASVKMCQAARVMMIFCTGNEFNDLDSEFLVLGFLSVRILQMAPILMYGQAWPVFFPS